MARGLECSGGMVRRHMVGVRRLVRGSSWVERTRNPAPSSQARHRAMVEWLTLASSSMVIQEHGKHSRSRPTNISAPYTTLQVRARHILDLRPWGDTSDQSG